MSSENNLPIELYHSVLNEMPYGIIVADITGKFILWNDNARPIVNDELAKSLQQNWVDDFGVFNIDKTTKYRTEDLPMSKALRGESSPGEKMYIKHAGLEEGVYLKVSSYPIKKEDQIIAGVIIMEDITQEQILYDNIISKINELETYLKDIMDIELNSSVKLNRHVNRNNNQDQ
jgi:signal transduction histidine kinase